MFTLDHIVSKWTFALVNTIGEHAYSPRSVLHVVHIDIALAVLVSRFCFIDYTVTYHMSLTHFFKRHKSYLHICRSPIFSKDTNHTCTVLACMSREHSRFIHDQNNYYVIFPSQFFRINPILPNSSYSTMIIPNTSDNLKHCATAPQACWQHSPPVSQHRKTRSAAHSQQASSIWDCNIKRTCIIHLMHLRRRRNRMLQR
jgi:hypothetical protein